MHYHGTPITPNAVLRELAGRNFCVSFWRPDQVKTVHEIGQSVMLDNGAFSAWRRGIEIDWKAWRVWVDEWLDHPNTWCVLPDTVDGGVWVNECLLRHYGDVRKGVPVWHLHEDYSRLVRLVDRYERVCFGSSGQYATVASAPWHERVSVAFDVLADEFGRVPWIHMLRGMRFSGGDYPFASVDSTDIARNHNRPQNTARGMADRWDALQAPALWRKEAA